MVDFNVYYQKRKTKARKQTNKQLTDKQTNRQIDKQRNKQKTPHANLPVISLTTMLSFLCDILTAPMIIAITAKITASMLITSGIWFELSVAILICYTLC